MADGTAAWHRTLGHTPHDQVSGATTQTSGMRRFAGISGALTGSETLWMGESHVSGGVRSEDHHHGASETGIYVLEGNPVFVFLENGAERRIVTSPGDYVFVPPFVPHREENPGPDDAVVVLARTSQEAIVVNLASLSQWEVGPGGPTSDGT